MRSIKFSLQVVVTAVTLAGLGLGLVSCSDLGNTKALSHLIFNGILKGDGGAFLSADGIVSEVAVTLNDEADISITNDPVRDTTDVASNELYDVLLKTYTVSFERTDGGTAVPSTFGVRLTQRLPINATSTVTLLVLRPEQKYVPPLGDLQNFGVELETGYPTIQTLATVHMYGENLVGDGIELKFQFKVTFCRKCKA